MHPASSSSYTQTYTIPPCEPASSFLVQSIELEEPSISLQSKLQSLLAKMTEACEKIPGENRESSVLAINEWGQDVFQRYQLDSPLGVDLDDVTYDMCFFYSHRIEYIMSNYVDTMEEKRVWLALGNELKQILSGILPEGKNVDDVLAMYHPRETLRQELQVLEKARELLDQLEDDLYRRANEQTEQTLATFEVLKEELLHIIRERNLSLQEIHQRLDIVTEKAAQLYQSYDATLRKTQSVFARFDDQEKVLGDKLAETQNILEEMK